MMNENLGYAYSYKKDGTVEVRCFGDDYSFLELPNISNIRLYHIPINKDIKGHKDHMTVGRITEESVAVEGKRWRQLRNARNRYKDIVKAVPIDSAVVLEDALHILKMWATSQRVIKSHGMVTIQRVPSEIILRDYRKFPEHYGYVFYIGEEPVGFTVFGKYQGMWHLYTRKCVDGYSNLSQYMDWWTQKEIYDKDGESTIYLGSTCKNYKMEAWDVIEDWYAYTQADVDQGTFENLFVNIPRIE